MALDDCWDDIARLRVTRATPEAIVYPDASYGFWGTLCRLDEAEAAHAAAKTRQVEEHQKVVSEMIRAAASQIYGMAPSIWERKYLKAPLPGYVIADPPYRVTSELAGRVRLV